MSESDTPSKSRPASFLDFANVTPRDSNPTNDTLVEAHQAVDGLVGDLGQFGLLELAVSAGEFRRPMLTQFAKCAVQRARSSVAAADAALRKVEGQFKAAARRSEAMVFLRVKLEPCSCVHRYVVDRGLRMLQAFDFAMKKHLRREHHAEFQAWDVGKLRECLDDWPDGDLAELARRFGTFKPGFQKRLREELEREFGRAAELGEPVAEAMAPDAGVETDNDVGQPLGFPVPETRHSKDFTYVCWYGVDHKFTKTQAACVKVLWEAWESNTPILKEETILEKAGSEGSRLRDVFKTNKGTIHDAWKTMIVSASKGCFRLKEPEKT